MFPNRRAGEMPSTRRSCHAPGQFHPYDAFPDAPFPPPGGSVLRGQPEYPRFDSGFLQAAPNLIDVRQRDRPNRMLPYGGVLEGGVPGMMPGMMTPVRTVPTAITVPPSKQLRSVPRADSTQPSESTFPPFANVPPPNYIPPQSGMPIQDTSGPVQTGFDPRVTPSGPPDAIQNICALVIAHCGSCKEEVCVLGEKCKRIKSLWRHIAHCTLKERCTQNKWCRCSPVRTRLAHFKNCRFRQCPICTPLRHQVEEVRWHINCARNGRIKRETADFNAPADAFPTDNRAIRPSPVRRQHYTGQMEPPMGLVPSHAKDMGTDLDLMFCDPMTNNGSFVVDPPMPSPRENCPVGAPIHTMPYTPLTPDASRSMDSQEFKLGTSLFETFDPMEIEAYLKAVRGSDAFPEKPDQLMKDRICAVCLQGEQTFQPIQLYCDCCFARIKRGGMYWKSKVETKVQICACHRCYTAKKNGNLTVGQLSVPLVSFQSCRNDECVTETWVECDKCGYWIHSSCGLFNRGENNDNAKYMCPFCLKEEMEVGHRTKPAMKPVSMWGADELPECPLSDFIQSHVNREVMAEVMKPNFADVVCHPLAVRVLMSTKKVTKVLPVFEASFPDLPHEYPYYQKVIGVFQKIHGVDVLLFCMYVQEYSDDCKKPNQRWVNLEYIDSVKHFMPDVKTMAGESLRSVVYKETLLAYIEFVKRCGFEVFYIWACPPGKEGEDYILHCKPKNQRIPSADRLRIWYKDVLKTAKQRNIVTHDSNLMDTFFTSGEDRAVGRPFSAAEMPYFEGDYWPGEAEKILKALRSNKSGDWCRKPGEKRKTRGEMSLDESLENGLMVSLPFPRWSDFMVWHLQEPCSLCQTYITAGNKYVYHFENTTSSTTTTTNASTTAHVIKSTDSSKKRAHFEGIRLGRQGGSHSNTQFFQICEACYQTCRAIGEGRPIPDCVNFAELEQEEVVPVTAIFGEFNSSEESRFSEIFESRQAFLAFCKGNHYQFDTLQHAKHSTMMLLYHLHNTKAPVFPTLCRGCGIEIPLSAEASEKNKRLPELCRACSSQSTMIVASGGVNNGTAALGGAVHSDLAQNKFSNGTLAHRGRRVCFSQVTDSFEHAAYCGSNHCILPECQQMKDIFKHVRHCQVGTVGKCRKCSFFTLFVKRHAHFCNRPCFVPDCERIKAVRKQQMRLDQAQRSRVYFGEASGSSSSS